MERDINDPRYKPWRAAVFSRDNGRCRVCGGRGEEVHHIVTWAKDPIKRYDINNGMTLCKSCHEKTGSYYKPKAKFNLKNLFRRNKSRQILQTSAAANTICTVIPRLGDDSTPQEKASAIEILMDNMKKRYIP